MKKLMITGLFLAVATVAYGAPESPARSDSSGQRDMEPGDVTLGQPGFGKKEFKHTRNKKNTSAIDRSTAAQSSADNTKTNQRDDSANGAAGLTAEQQGSGERDTEITRQIRQEIMKQSDLSVYAQNIKIITSNGQVTLKGPVRSAQEERVLVKKARAVAGVSKVRNEIDVVPNK